MSARTNRIITLLIVVLILATTAPTFAGKIIYVDDDGPADFNNIQAAINDANHGDTIIVAEGWYFENINFNGRNITLTSTDPCNPDVVTATIIDGNQNGSVVTFNSGEDANCVLNGFTITNGNAERGGGIYCDWESSPTLTNCVFTDNLAIGSRWWGGRGGGMYNMGGSPTLTNCVFTDNSAIDDKGGGMYNYESSPTLTNCTFTGNSAVDSGGGMYNYESDPTLTNCTFTDNSAVSSGPGGSSGGGMCNFNSSPTLTNCTFSGNFAVGGVFGSNGGGMCNYSSSPTITNCIFSGNSADGEGGGMCNVEGCPTLTNCVFTDNSAIGSGMGGRNGGGMCNNHSSPTLTNCTFTYNSAVGSGMPGGNGGGMCNVEGGPTLTNCTFTDNSAIGSGREGNEGGGMINFGSSPTLTNCAFSGNSANKGGAMYNFKSNLMLKNCTFAVNSAPKGSALACDSRLQQYPSNLQITNCILWDCGYEIWNNDNSKITVTYSDIHGGWPGEGNIDADPRFVQPGYWDSNDTPQDPRDDVWIDGDYHLLPDSPCINTGDPNHLFDPNETDLDGRPRVMGGRIDMGAYEAPIFAEARILPRTINLASKGNWITCYIWMPEDYDVADIDPNSVFLEEHIKGELLLVNEQEQSSMARFNRSDVQAILDIGDIELTITGRLNDGTVFEVTDVIRVIDKGGKEN